MTTADELLDMTTQVDNSEQDNTERSLVSIKGFTLF